MPKLTTTDRKEAELPLHGFLDDGVPSGFKTPVFKNGAGPMVQVVGSNGLIAEFAACDEEDRLRIIRRNFRDRCFARLSEPPIYLYDVGGVEGAIYGPRVRLVSRLTNLLRRDDSVNAFDALDILIFVNAGRSEISAAADRAELELKRLGYKNTTEWRGVIGHRIGTATATEQKMVGSASLPLDTQILLEKLDQRIAGMPKNSFRSHLAHMRDQYLMSKTRWETGKAHMEDKAIRTLFYIMTEADRGSVEELALLARVSYGRRVLARYLRTIMRDSNREATLDLAASNDRFTRFAHSAMPTSISQLAKWLAEYPISNPTGIQTGTVLFGTVRSTNGSTVTLSAHGLNFSVQFEDLANAWQRRMPVNGEFGCALSVGDGRARQRGTEFVQKVFETFFPSRSDYGGAIDYQMGTSLSWAVLTTTKRKAATLRAAGGFYLEEICVICGLRGIAVVQRSTNAEIMIRSFLASLSPSSRILSRSENAIEIGIPGYGVDPTAVDPKRMRVFHSMWSVAFPALSPTYYLLGPDLERGAQIDLVHICSKLSESTEELAAKFD